MSTLTEKLGLQPTASRVKHDAKYKSFNLEDVRNVLDMTLERVEPWSNFHHTDPFEPVKNLDWLVHTRLGLYAVAVASSGFIFQSLPDILNSFDLSWRWWLAYFLLVLTFYQYLRPVVRGTLGSVSDNHLNWHNIVVLWLFSAFVVHLPRFQHLGVDVKADVGVFLTIFLGTLLLLTCLHFLHRLLSHLRLLPPSQTQGASTVVCALLVNSLSISTACCLFFSACEPLHAIDQHNQPVRHLLCARLLGPLKTTSDFPAYRKWVLYTEPTQCAGNIPEGEGSPLDLPGCGGDGSVGEQILPLFSLWSTFVCMIIANSLADAWADDTLDHHPHPPHTSSSSSSWHFFPSSTSLPSCISAPSTPHAINPSDSRRTNMAHLPPDSPALPCGGDGICRETEQPEKPEGYVENDTTTSCQEAKREADEGSSSSWPWSASTAGTPGGGDDEISPGFLPMVPWYDTQLLSTAVNLLVSLKIFQGRFDMRCLQYVAAAAERRGMEGVEDGILFDHLSDRSELWFDFMADTGDGGDSTYSVVRCMAQPSLCLPLACPLHPPPVGHQHQGAQQHNSPGRPSSLITLPRSALTILGGDLAYPNPTEWSYSRRLFAPFEAALPPPDFAASRRVATTKPDLPPHCHSLRDYTGPQLFAIPGNHDWFDGLETFLRRICFRSWLGGWLMPQQHSFFALKLPQGWWMFGLDLSLHEDIDLHQLKYFAKVCSGSLAPSDAVIIATHQPVWLLDWYTGTEAARNESNLACLLGPDHIGSRARVWLAGDLHHYMRHRAHHHHYQHHKKQATPVSHPPPPPPPAGGGPIFPPHLVVCGGGGAFLHPTHPFQDFKEFGSGQYSCSAAFPSFQTSRMIGACLLPLFRERNWRFDIIGGAVYFLLALSAFPQCGVLARFPHDSLLANLPYVPHVLMQVMAAILTEAYVSVAAVVMMTVTLVGFIGAPHSLPVPARVLLGWLHSLAHWLASLSLMLVLELGLDLCTHHGMLGNVAAVAASSTDFSATGHDGNMTAASLSSKPTGLWEAYFAAQETAFPDPNGLRAMLQRWTAGAYPAVLQYLFAVFDMPDLMASTRVTVCSEGWGAVPRSTALLYFIANLLYFWVLCVPVVSWIFGCYLYLCVNWLHIHFDEAFSALRIPHYKSFLRLNITDDGALHLYAIGIRKVPRKWTRNINQNAGTNGKSDSRTISGNSPSKWIPAPGQPGSKDEAGCGAEIVDHIRIQKRPRS